MAGRRLLVGVVLLAALLHAISIGRSFLPAQDGLKFIHVAHQFQQDDWPDVVRETDQHPLYPALVAAAQPVVAFFRGGGPDTWRIAAQAVAAIASIALLIPLFGLARALFDTRIACMAAVIYMLLPVPAEVGHDTLSDSLGLLAILLGLRSGVNAVRPQEAGELPWPRAWPAASATWPVPRPSSPPRRWAWHGSPGWLARSRSRTCCGYRGRQFWDFRPLASGRLCAGEGTGFRKAGVATRSSDRGATDYDSPCSADLAPRDECQGARFLAQGRHRADTDSQSVRGECGGWPASGGTSSAGGLP